MFTPICKQQSLLITDFLLLMYYADSNWIGAREVQGVDSRSIVLNHAWVRTPLCSLVGREGESLKLKLIQF